MPAEFDGLSVVVTGGNAGIGRATANEFRARGARVGIIDLRVDELEDGIVGAKADLASQAQTSAAMDELAHALGGIDVLVNNAGISFVGGIEDGSETEWHHLFDINVLGYVRATRAALPYLRNSDHAAIVNVSSCTAVSGVHQRALYSATKGAISSMSLSMAVDLLADGVRVNCVRPGTVDTPFMAELAAVANDPAQRRKEFEQRQPIGRMVAADEVATAIVYLASPRSGASYGVTLDVDGGLGRLLV